NDRRYKLEPGTGHEGCPPLLGRAECHDDAVVARIQTLVNTVLKSVALERELAHLQRFGTASKAEMIRDLERQYPGLPLRVHRLDDLGPLLLAQKGVGIGFRRRRTNGDEEERHSDRARKERETSRRVRRQKTHHRLHRDDYPPEASPHAARHRNSSSAATHSRSR